MYDGEEAGTQVRWQKDKERRHNFIKRFRAARLIRLRNDERAARELEAIAQATETAMISLSLEGRIFSWSAGATAIYGYKPEEMIGQSVFQLVPLGNGRELQERLKLVAKGSFLRSLETTHLRADGTYVEVSLSLFPVMSREGEVLSAAWISFDVTEKKRAEARIKQLSNVVEQTTDGVMITDKLGIIEYVNRGFELMSGYSSAEVIGRTPRFLKSGKHDSQFYQNLWSVLLEGKSYSNLLISKKKDGSLFYTQKTISPLKGTNGEITHFVSTDKDVTESRLAEEKYQALLNQSNTELKQFASVASHDLQEPLRSIALHLQVLEAHNENTLDEDSKTSLKFAMDAATRLKALIRDVLAYSYVGNLRRGNQVLDCNKVLESVINQLGASIDRNGAKIETETLPQVTGTVYEFTALFQNLISNALKYHAPNVNPVIRISAMDLGNEWQFSVSDNGIGIKDEDRVRCFSMFTRLHSASEYEGTGMGLATCRKIVEMNQGRIWIDPNPSGGSIFWWTWPKG